MSINIRISELISKLGDNDNSFAKRIGVSTSVIFNIVNPKGRMSYPSGPVLEKILAIEKDGILISAEWLMRGKGEMFSHRPVIDQEDTKAIYKTIDELSKSVSKLQEDFETLKNSNRE